jgi:uncharacterized protein (DUF1697 family)
MTTWVALLRAVNVGGTGKLPMSELKAFCEELGLKNVRTYIASGNVVFDSALSEAKIKAVLEARLQAHAGRKVDVMVRSAEQMAAVVAANPFSDRPGNRVVAIFLDTAPASDAIATTVGRKDEEIALGTREIYVFYSDGVGNSRLQIPSARTGTGRNMNTVAELVRMAAA